MTKIDLLLLNDFIVETDLHLEEIEACLQQLEAEPGNRAALDAIFTVAHMIKGAGLFVGLDRISRLALSLEDLLNPLLGESVTVADRTTIEMMRAAKDRLKILLRELEKGPSEESPVDDLIELIQQRLASSGGAGATAPIDEDNFATAGGAESELVQLPTSGMEPNITPSEMAGVDSEELDQRIKIEVDGEAYDAGPFKIFSQQLIDKVAHLRGWSTELATSDLQSELLENCLKEINLLKSSANDMGFRHLNYFYQLWHDQLFDLRKGLVANKRLSAASTAFMHCYLDRLSAIFDQLDWSVAAAPTEQPAVVEQKISKPLKLLTEVTPPVADATPALNSDEPIAASGRSSEEQALFNQLSEALDASLSEGTDDPQQQLFDQLNQALNSALYEAVEEAPAEDIFDEMLSSSSEAPSESGADKPPVEKPAKSQEAKESSGQPLAGMPPESDAEHTTAEGGESPFSNSVRIDSEKIDALMSLAGELIVDRSNFFRLFNEIRLLQDHLQEDIGLNQRDMKELRSFSNRFNEAIISLGRTSNELQAGVMGVHMLPISQLFSHYPRLVHELTRSSAKQVRLEMRGEETELDKVMIEALSDPLIDIISHAIDHGFESGDERKKTGKSVIGELIVEAFHESNYIVVEVVDDGHGLNPDTIKRNAPEKDFFNEQELNRMGDNDVERIIMTPGFSATESVTNRSGRDVSMDMVKEKVGELNGTIDIDSAVGKGTRVRIRVPLTLAIISALMVRVGSNFFSSPLANVEETLHVFEQETSVIEGTEVIHLRERTMPVFRLSKLFNISSDLSAETKSFVVIVNTGLEPVGIVVDELMGQERVVVKPLVDYLQKESGFSGATIIGDGQISLILDLHDLVSMTTTSRAGRHHNLAQLCQASVIQ